MKFRIALLTATVLAAPFAFNHAAKAQPVTGLYVGGGAGYSTEEKVKAKDGTVGGAPVANPSRVSLYGGWTGEGSVGYGFGNGLRVEVEGDYIDNRFKNITPEGVGYAGKASGHEQKYGVFLNALYDFDVGLPYLYPYVGGGVGYQIDRLNGFGGPNGDFNKGKPVLAYQGIAGIAFPIAAVPGLSATVEYRFIGDMTSRKYWGEYGGQAASFKIIHEYNNEVLIGARYALPRRRRPPLPLPLPLLPLRRRRRPRPIWCSSTGINPILRRRRSTSSPRPLRTAIPSRPPISRSTGTRIPLVRFSTTRVSASAALNRLPPNWLPTAFRSRKSRSNPTAKRICWCRPAPACANRRTAAWRLSSSSSGSSLTITAPGRKLPGVFCGRQDKGSKNFFDCAPGGHPGSNLSASGFWFEKDVDAGLRRHDVGR